MNLTEGMAKANNDYEFPPYGFIFVNDDNEMFWSNMRPALQDGYWGSNSHGFMTEYIGVYTGSADWKHTLKQL